jgi:hypothetical protein
MTAIAPQVSHRPVSLVTEPSSVSRHGRFRLQSMPVDGLRCTLSTASDQTTIGKAQARTLTSAA